MAATKRVSIVRISRKNLNQLTTDENQVNAEKHVSTSHLKSHRRPPRIDEAPTNNKEQSVKKEKIYTYLIKIPTECF
jgi:hypothetical protein